MAARIVGPALPVGGYEQATADHLTLLARRDEPIDTLVAGSSVIGAGVDPAQLSDSAERVDAAHNVWLAGAGMQTVSRTLVDVVLRQHRPTRLVIGVTSRLFNASNGSDELDRAVRESYGYRADTGTLPPLGELERLVGEVSASSATATS